MSQPVATLVTCVCCGAQVSPHVEKEHLKERSGSSHLKAIHVANKLLTIVPVGPVLSNQLNISAGHGQQPGPRLDGIKVYHTYVHTGPVLLAQPTCLV